jgi:hypothetical protein
LQAQFPNAWKKTNRMHRYIDRLLCKSTKHLAKYCSWKERKNYRVHQFLQNFKDALVCFHE